jgi:hypothetical protein
MNQRFETAANLRTLMSYMPRFIAPLTLACALSFPLLAGCGRGASA